MKGKIIFTADQMSKKKGNGTQTGSKQTGGQKGLAELFWGQQTILRKMYDK